jgi:hypothetical protein
MDPEEVKIKTGPNGLYVDDGENLRNLHQPGNGSQKPKSTGAIIRQLAPLGD